jgi:hypothetical protein
MPQNTPRGYSFPLYPDVQNFPVQIQDLAQDIDADIQAIADLGPLALDRVTARAQDPGSVAIAPNTTTAVPFTIQAFDYGNIYNPGTPTLMTFPESGIYQVSISVEFLANGNATVGGRALYLTSSGALTPVVARESRLGNQNRNTSLDLSSLYMAVAAGETISAFVRHNSGANVSIADRWMSVTKLTATATGT